MEKENRVRKATPHQSMLWAFAGSTLLVLFLALTILSKRFTTDIDLGSRPIICMISIMMGAGVLYLLVVLGLKGTSLSKGHILWILAVGLLLRFCMFFSTPILEDDYYRYLWDGGVLANGFNPYKYSPEEISDGDSEKIPAELQSLAENSGIIIERVNHPWLRTIYPPVTEVAFAAAYLIKPWSLNAWRFVLLIFDMISLCLLFLILRRLNISLIGIVIYWWNPLLIKEIYNSCHMEMIIFPFLLGTCLFGIINKRVLSAGVLGLAVGAKFWPAILLPVAVRPILKDPKRLIAALILFGIISVLMFAPFYMAGLDSESGFRAYGSYWEMNDTIFMVILGVVRFAIDTVGADDGLAQGVTRTAIVCILLCWTLWIVRNKENDSGEAPKRFLFIAAALFLLSPTQFPWYSLWLLPFLAIRPRASLLLLTALMPLYYMRFYLKPRDLVHIHDYGIVWLEFVPVWWLLIGEWWKSKKDAFSVAPELD